MRRLKLILLFRSIPNDDIKLRELLERFGLIERFTPYVSGGRLKRAPVGVFGLPGLMGIASGTFPISGGAVATTLPLRPLFNYQPSKGASL